MAEEKKSRVKAALGGKKKKSSIKKKGGKKHVHRMHISRTDNGKFLVDHEFKGSGEPGEMPPENEQHAVEPEDLAQHVTDHMGAGGEEGAPAAGPGPGGPVQTPPMGA